MANDRLVEYYRKELRWLNMEQLELLKDAVDELIQNKKAQQHRA